MLVVPAIAIVCRSQTRWKPKRSQRLEVFASHFYNVAVLSFLRYWFGQATSENRRLREQYNEAENETRRLKSALRQAEDEVQTLRPRVRAYVCVCSITIVVSLVDGQRCSSSSLDWSHVVVFRCFPCQVLQLSKRVTETEQARKTLQQQVRGLYFPHATSAV